MWLLLIVFGVIVFFVARIAWGVVVAAMGTSLWLHERRVRAATSPEVIAKLRREFADALGLGGELWDFYTDVHSFPHWYKGTSADGAPWSSSVIAREDIREYRAAEQVAEVGIDPAVLKDGSGECLVYVFESGGKSCAFCSSASRHPFAAGYDEGGVQVHERLVWVVEKPDRVVLKASLCYYWTEYGDNFSGAYVHAFKPGPWMQMLLDTAKRVHEEQRERYERWSKERERKQAEENFV